MTTTTAADRVDWREVLRGRPIVTALTLAVVAVGLFTWLVVGSSRQEAALAALANRPVAVFLGDSYTAGEGAQDVDHRWSTVLAAHEGWTEVNAGIPGTGYLETGSWNACGRERCGGYLTRLETVVAAEPDIVLVAGGQNDVNAYGTSPDEVRAAVREVYADLRADLPDTRIVVVGPSSPWGDVPTVRGISDIVAQEAARAGLEHVDLLDDDVLRAGTLVADDGIHADDEGHAAITRRVAAAID